jgi:hypothetical protein
MLMRSDQSGSNNNFCPSDTAQNGVADTNTCCTQIECGLRSISGKPERKGREGEAHKAVCSLN